MDSEKNCEDAVSKGIGIDEFYKDIFNNTDRLIDFYLETGENDPTKRTYRRVGKTVRW